VERVAKFPRELKLTVGERLVDTGLDLMCHLLDARVCAARGDRPRGALDFAP
jgi:hypothetical protein